MISQTLTLTNRVHLPLHSQPVRQGVPWPRGAVQPNAALTAHDESGTALPIGWRSLNCWPDGSVQWSLVDLGIDFPPSGTRRVEVAASDAPAVATLQNPVEITRSAAGIEVSNGLTRFTVVASDPTSLVNGWEAGDFDAVIVDPAGTHYSAARCTSRSMRVEDANPLRATIRIDGQHQADDGRRLLDYWIRFVVTANRRDVKITYHYHNLEKQEPGIDLVSMQLQLRTRLPRESERAIVHACRGRDTRPEPIRLCENLEICSSDTMDLANYPETHQGITGGGAGRVFISDPQLLRDDPLAKPWFLRNIVNFKFQNKDMPEAYVWSPLGLVSDCGSLVVAGGNMVGLHPKSLAIDGSVVTYSIWPRWAGTMDITQGEGRTLDFYVGPLHAGASDMELIAQFLAWEMSNIYSHWGAQPTIDVSLDIEHARRCEVFEVEKLPRFDPDQRFAFERKVQAQWAPDEAAPPNGHWHYGDVFARWDIGVNNEEMVGHVWFQEYLRTGRPTCLARGLAQAQHIADVDICAWSADPYQNGGMCSHGPRHNHTAAYPSHMWFTEMLFAYALTGDEEFRKAAVRVCDNLVFWINDERGFANICADGRESGQPLINLAWTYQFVPDQRYLDAMWKVVRGSFMDRVSRHGLLVYMKPREDFALIRYTSYGEWAAWEGLFCVWQLTRDEPLRQFILSQLDWRLQEQRMATSGAFRNTDFNVAAYAWLMTGDRQWLDRVARPFKAIFRSVQWPIGYIKSMYYIELAFQHGIINDDDILLA